MPTVRGWAATGAALALTVLWVGFGEELLLGSAAFLLLAVGFAVIYVRRRVPRVAIERKITPIQVHDGERAIVEVAVRSNRRLQQVTVEDTVRGLGAARFVADRVDQDVPSLARYEVLCRPRGIYQVGPAAVIVQDALAMAESGGLAGRADRLVVYPAVEDFHGVPAVRGQDPNVNTSQASFSQTGGDDFFTLREYQHGDDLRRVHWPSSAKKGDLMIRQLEMPWQSRALVLLDPRVSSYTGPEAFEHAVRGAASAVRHLFAEGFSPSLWTGLDSAGTVGTAKAYTLAMEELATAQATADVDLRAIVARMRRIGMNGSALVLVTGAPDDTDLAVFRLLSRDYVKAVVMSVAVRDNEAIIHLRRAGAIVIRTGTGSPWAPAWREAMERTWSTATAG